MKSIITMSLGCGMSFVCGVGACCFNFAFFFISYLILVFMACSVISKETEKKEDIY